MAGGPFSEPPCGNTPHTLLQPTGATRKHEEEAAAGAEAAPEPTRHHCRVSLVLLPDFAFSLNISKYVSKPNWFDPCEEVLLSDNL